ncbi:MAG TPA: prolyl oligopeptidase family serine peptidase [Kofleriaceae bacterium]|nr:prolyl oligopeptidase family serine peptidase [Kofleriaceae bacterium]
MRATWILLAIGCGSSSHSPTYPAARHGEVPDDPYRWLEQMDSPETTRWVAAENRLTDAALADVPGATELRARLAQLYAREEVRPPVHRGERYFWSKRDAAHDQSIVEVATSASGTATMLLDPGELAKDGSVQLAGWSPSWDGELLAYGLSSGGGDWTRWRFRDAATGTDLPDELPDTKYYVPAFTADHRGVYYSRFPTPARGKELTEPDHDCRVYFHAIGTPVASDRVIYERPDHPSWQFEPHTTRDGRYLVIAIGDGEVGDSSKEMIAVLDLGMAGAAVRPLVESYDAEYVFIGALGSHLYFETNTGAPTKKIVMVDADAPATWHDIVPAGRHPIDSATLAGGQLIVSELVDAHMALVAYDPEGQRLHDIALPGIGAVYGLHGSPSDRDAFYYYTSFTAPGATYQLELSSGRSTPWRPTPLAFDPSDFATTQVFFASKDGTKVPMFITAKKELPLDGSHPTLLTGYGGFGVPILPYFDPKVLAWVERGGVAVLANIRGGGEYGDAWHHAAWREHAQVKLDDFAAAAEWLIAHHWTSPRHLGMYGTSGGGLLVGAVLVERPELFGAAAPIAGVLDLMRFHRFGQGAGWQDEFGHPDVPAEAAWLRKISPLHNVRPGTHYPATYVVTSDHDVRVPPLHSYKFAAAMQAAQAGDAPILLRVETESGHGGGGLRSQEIAQNAELLVFFAKYLGLPLADRDHSELVTPFSPSDTTTRP